MPEFLQVIDLLLNFCILEYKYFFPLQDIYRILTNKVCFSLSLPAVSVVRLFDFFQPDWYEMTFYFYFISLHLLLCMGIFCYLFSDFTVLLLDTFLLGRLFLMICKKSVCPCFERPKLKI